MKRWKLAVLIAGCAALATCGEVTSSFDAAVAADAIVSDSSINVVDAAGAADAAPIDATIDATIECVNNSECNNNVFCDGVELCLDNSCVDGNLADCGVSDVCIARFCDTVNDGCAQDTITYTINWNNTGSGNSGNLDLKCSIGSVAEVFPTFCPTGAPEQLLLTCSLSSGGLLFAIAQSQTGCLAPVVGTQVAIGCSTAVVPGLTTFRCCWP